MNSITHGLRAASSRSAPRQPSAGMLLLVLAVLALLDHLAGADFSLRLFYLMPVALAACVFGRKGGLAVAALCTTFCVFFDGAVRTTAEQQTAQVAWDVVSSGVLFTLFAS